MSLLREAQAALLGAFDRADTVTAGQLHAAAARFSEKTENRARAKLTRDGVLVRSRRGMEGEVIYKIAGHMAPATTLGHRSLSITRQPRQRMATHDVATLPAKRYHDDYDYADDDDYDYADDDDETGYERSGTAGWLIPIGIFACGLAGVVLVRRRFGAFSIGKSDGTARAAQLPPFTPSIAPRARQTPAYRAARNAPIVAPRPDDSAIYGPDPAPDEMWDPDPAVGPNAYERFAAFPGLFDFYPDSDT